MENREMRIKEKLLGELSPLHLEVTNESGGHNVPKGSETHFKVVIVSDVFKGLGRVGRQQKVYDALKDEFSAGLHALSQYTYTPEEWRGASPESPPCAGVRKPS